MCSEAAILCAGHTVFTQMVCLFVVACGGRSGLEDGKGLTPC